MDLIYQLTYNDNMTPAQEAKIINGWEKINYKLDTYNIIKSRFHDASHIPGLNQVFENMAINVPKKTLVDHLMSHSIIDEKENSNISK